MMDVFHECLSICTLVYYVFTMFIFSTTPYNTQRFGRSLETRLQAADVKFLRACSFLFMRFRPGAECLGSQVCRKHQKAHVQTAKKLQEKIAPIHIEE